MLFDSHAHLSHELFAQSREEIIKKLCVLGIKVVNIGVGSEEFEKTVALAEKNPKQIWAAIGFHPDDAKVTDEDFVKLKDFAVNKNVVAIGECGLDYYRNLENQNLQKEVFIKQIELAQELKKPLIIHCRPTMGTSNAYEDAIEILKFKHLNISSGNGVAHFFSGTVEMAKKFLDLGFYISFAGPITFAEEYKEVVEYVPNDKILAETDSPFAAPFPYRGKRNEPAFVEFVVRQIALWKGLSFEEAARLTTENAEKLFQLP
ncbi:MAG: TatD family hydrolase [Candidatus Azambacteria bacterium]|nr:TatD family hydrolase [Candidatus Azambacteria bacterium]